MRDFSPARAEAWAYQEEILSATWGGNPPVLPISPREFTDAALSDAVRTRLCCLSPDSCDFVTSMSNTTRSRQSITGTRATVPSRAVQVVVRSVAQRRFDSGTTTCPRRSGSTRSQMGCREASYLTG